jgi:hypothetical protein
VPWKPDYITTAELKSYLDIGDAVDDVQLAMWCTAASRAIEAKTNRQFGQLSAAAARTYRGPAFFEPESGLWQLEVDDVQDVTGMTVGGVAYASSGATLLPDNAPADGLPWTRLGFTSCPTMPLVVVARWGWSAVPAQVVGAAKLQANRWNARRSSPLGIAGSPDQGSEMRLLARLDPDVATVLVGLARRRKAG